MRYPAEHKHLTRRRIVEAASAAFREQGVVETGVDAVMKRAGLTHGGFYAHFRDKAELVAEACAAAFDAAVPNLDRIAARPTAAERARLLIDSYLSGGHRDNRGTGCVVVAVGADAARLSGTAREGYSRGLGLHIDRLCAALRLHEDAAENRARVTHLMSSLVGALLFARATTGPEASAEILRVMRRRLKAEFGQATASESATEVADSASGRREKRTERTVVDRRDATDGAGELNDQSAEQAEVEAENFGGRSDSGDERGSFTVPSISVAASAGAERPTALPGEGPETRPFLPPDDPEEMLAVHLR